MKRRTVSGITLIVLVSGMLILAFDVQSVKATGFIHIRADGSVDPLTAPIKRDSNVYTLMADIYDRLILIERSDIVVDGNGHKLQGVFAGFSIMPATNYVTIKDAWISSTSGTGIFSEVSSHITIVQNVITSCGCSGIYLHSLTSHCLIRSNIIEDCEVGITLNATAGNNQIFHNDFINNVWQVWSDGSFNVWDNGYPSGGNYWSDYFGTDANNDGIGDTPYVIDKSNEDRYPLMNPWVKPPPPNKPPVARFTHSPRTPKIGQRVTFDASTSSDPDGTIFSYKWNFGDAHTKIGKIVTHSYSNARNYNVKLTVKDNDGDSSSMTRTVTVVKPKPVTDPRIGKGVAWALDWADGKPYPKSDPRYSWRLYSGLCLAFVTDAYEFGAGCNPTHYPSAKSAAESLKPLRKGTPPAGAYVFYEWYPWGHVGLSLGSGRMVHTRLGGKPPVVTSYKIGLKYLGWAWPPVKPPIKTSGLSVKATCPIDLVVTDPEDLIITKEFSQISEALYIEEDLNDDGSLEDYIFIPEQKEGAYKITVVAEPDADPTATYSLEVSTEDSTLLLAENVPISDIPTDPYFLDSTTFDTPPVTLLTIGDPQYIDPLDNIYVSASTRFNLTAEDNMGGSGVISTSYRICEIACDTGWLNYTEPFNLTRLTDGVCSIDYNSTDYAGNVEPTKTITVILDNTPPSLTVEAPAEDEALQDGITLQASAWDLSATSLVSFSVREPNGGQGKIITPIFESMPATCSPEQKWILSFDTTQLPDGYYLFVANGTDVLGNTGVTIVEFSIRNWACLELLPASQCNKAGRTMPVKFSLKVTASVDFNQPFVRNEELAIIIYEENHPESVLQNSTYGTTATDYRIDGTDELYITNLKTLKTPTTYVVEICRKGMPIDSFRFETVK